MPFAPSRPAIKLKVLTKFPAAIVATAGLAVARLNSIYTFTLDFLSLTPNAGISDPSLFKTVIYNTATGNYEQVLLNAIPTSTTGDVRTAHGDTNYSILTTDAYVALTATLTADRTWTLPAANTVPGGKRIVVQDEGGGISNAFRLLFSTTGTDTLDGVNGAAALTLAAKYGRVEFRSDGSGKWTVERALVRRTVGDAAATILSSDRTVALTAALTTARIWTLPAASSVQPGTIITAQDEIGGVTSTNTLTIAAAGSDTVNGGASYILANQWAGAAFISNGVSSWSVRTLTLTNALLPAMPANTVKGNATGSTATPTDLTGAQFRDSVQATGAAIDSVMATYATNADLTTNIPLDDTIPQITEGTQVLSGSITPKSTTNKISVRVQLFAACSAGAQPIIAALFRNGGTNAIASTVANTTGANSTTIVAFEFEDVPASTSAQAYTVRVGGSSATIRLNGSGAGRYFGGVAAATLKLTEIKA